jgi:hypothetical protein
VGAAEAPALPVAPSDQARCTARSTAPPPTVVDLYTSEGCSSCPPADRWLSSLKGRPGVVALAFHVNYWDGLGWRDRFATPAFTQRQRDLMRPSGSRVVYTPQVIIDGQDWRGWPAMPAGSSTRPAAPSVTLRREGDAVLAAVAPWRAPLSGYWALLEDGHVSRVRAGENRGETLTHDHVVRQYEVLPVWDAVRAREWRWSPAAPAGEGRNPARVVFVITDPASQKPLQAVLLSC